MTGIALHLKRNSRSKTMIFLPATLKMVFMVLFNKEIVKGAKKQEVVFLSGFDNRLCVCVCVFFNNHLCSFF